MEVQTFIVIVVIAFCLAMDAFAVSVASTVAYKQLKIGHVLRMAFFFGVFQAVMPVLVARTMLLRHSMARSRAVLRC